MVPTELGTAAGMLRCIYMRSILFASVVMPRYSLCLVSVDLALHRMSVMGEQFVALQNDGKINGLHLLHKFALKDPAECCSFNFYLIEQGLKNNS